MQSMNIWLAIALILAVTAMYMFIIEIFSVALKLTGLATSKIKFQVASLFTGTGFTTQESELIVNDEKRRKIALACIYVGHIFSVAIMGLIINVIFSIVQAVKTISYYFGDKELYRFGGDEFVLIMDDERYNNRKNLIDQFNRYIEGCINTDKPVISAGMSIYRRGQDNTYRAVFNRADKIMYSRKEMLKEREG